jgi:hypothetical protein
MFPIAIGMFQSETEASWTWFMIQLKRCLGPVSPLAVHTDACKGLENAVKVVFPHAEQSTTRKTTIGRKLPVAHQINGALRVYTRSAPITMRYA